MKFLHRLIAVSLLIAFSSCNNQNQTSNTDNLFKFKDYITYNTNGIQSISTAIRIDLSKPLEQFELTQEIQPEYVKITPKTKGRLLVENGRSLVFQPSDNLQSDTEYYVTVKLDKLYDDLSVMVQSRSCFVGPLMPVWLRSISSVGVRTTV